MYGGAKPDGFGGLRNQNQTLLSISAAVFICVILYLPTYQFVAVSFFLKKARAYYNFWGRSSGEGEGIGLGLGLGLSSASLQA